MIQVTTPASGVILIEGSNQSTKVLAPVNTKEARVASSADTLWEADGDGYIRPKGQAMVKGENVEIDISGKVDKVEGMGLSTEDFTTELAEKLAGLENYDDEAVLESISALSAKMVKDLSFSLWGDAEVEVEALGLPAPCALQITGITIFAKTAPAGSNLVLDINKNDVSLFTTQANRPYLAADSKVGTTVLPDVITIAKDDKITVDIDSVGSTTPGAGLMLAIHCEVI